MSSINEQNEPISGSFFGTSDVGRIFAWNEVGRIHKVRNGIYQKAGRLVSLLTDFGRINPCYPDERGAAPGTIFYTGAGRRGDQRLDSFNRALFAAIESGHAVPLFNKLKVGAWQFMGFWRVTEGVYVHDETQKRMIWRFTLQRSPDDGRGRDNRAGKTFA